MSAETANLISGILVKDGGSGYGSDRVGQGLLIDRVP